MMITALFLACLQHNVPEVGPGPLDLTSLFTLSSSLNLFGCSGQDQFWRQYEDKWNGQLFYPRPILGLRVSCLIFSTPSRPLTISGLWGHATQPKTGTQVDLVRSGWFVKQCVGQIPGKYCTIRCKTGFSRFVTLRPAVRDVSGFASDISYGWPERNKSGKPGFT